MEALLLRSFRPLPALPCLPLPACKPCSCYLYTECFKQFLASACRFFVPRLDGTLRSRIPFAFRAVSLRAAPDVFCVLHAVLLPSVTPACIGSALPLNFFPQGTMASADFCAFSAALQLRLRLSARSAQTSPGTTRFFPSIYLPHLPHAIPCSYWASTC